MSDKKQAHENLAPQNQALALDDSKAIAPIDNLSDVCMKNVKHQTHLATMPMNASDEVSEKNKVVIAAMLEGIKPRDAIEAMIAGQIIAIHEAVMNECRYASKASLSLGEVRAASINHAAKLNKSFTLLIETLNRYRHQDKIYQNLTVGHVDVHHGGQAVVGNITPQ